MKKLLTIFMFGLIFTIGIQQNTQAQIGDIELYPYDQEACLNAEPECTRTKVGDANWDISYNGYNYNVAGGQARYAVDFSDDNSNGMIDALEMPTNAWSSFGGIIMNDTASEVILETANRTDLTGAVHRIYVYFDENGDLAMFEDHYVTKYYIFNDGTEIDPDWRLATTAEADAFDAADPKPDTTMYTTIRISLDDVDSDGYVIEPLASLGWVAQGVDVGVDDVADWSSIIVGDPNYVYIPAGWTVVGFGTLDRDGSNAKTVDFIKTLPAALVAGTADPMVATYTDQPGSISGLVAHDDDLTTDGINIVIDYNGTFDLPNDIEASWLNMFDDTSGDIINSVDMIDYSVVISQNETDLETIDFVWNEGTTSYDPSGAVTSIDTSEFGSGYVATYSVTTPSGDVTTEVADIVIGVMPPKFAGVEDVYINEGTYIDLYNGITADDGYGTDITNSIILTQPVGFNTYSPLPGEYTMELVFTHHVHFDGEPSSLMIDGATSVLNLAQIDSVTALNVGAISDYAIFTDSAMVNAVTWAYGSVLVVVGADGLVDHVYDRYTWDVDDSTGAWNDGGATFETWKSAVVIETGGFAIGSHGSTLSGALRALGYDSPVSYINRSIDTVTINNITTEWDVANLDSVTVLNGGATVDYAIFTDSAMVHDVVWGYGTILVLVGADGLVDGVYDRYSWDVDDSTGAWNDGGATFETWKSTIAIEEGGFVIGSHGGTISPALRALTYDDSVSFLEKAVDFDYDIVTYESFVVTVDDITAPHVMAVNNDYAITVGDFDNIDEAILSNVAAFDLYDGIEDLAIYVSDNGGLVLTSPATYTVVVTAEDLAGNSSVVEFDVTVEAADVIITQAEIDAAIQAGIDAIPALEDATGCFGSIGNSSALFVFGIIATLGGAALYFIRKPQ
jgi:hypothetical protein